MKNLLCDYFFLRHPVVARKYKITDCSCTEVLLTRKNLRSWREPHCVLVW